MVIVGLGNGCLQGGLQRPPFRPDDIRRVMKAVPAISQRKACRLLKVPRSAMHENKLQTKPHSVVDEQLAQRIEVLMKRHPTFGYRRLWALLRFHEGLEVNKKAVYRILKVKGWFVHQRSSTPRPRVRGSRSRCERSDQRWAVDVTHFPCGRDGIAHLAEVIDCCDREIVGFELALHPRLAKG